jgi:hypothetical protein
LLFQILTLYRYTLETGELVSEVEMKIFDPFFALASGVSGTVVSSANVEVAVGLCKFANPV